MNDRLKEIDTLLLNITKNNEKIKTKNEKVMLHCNVAVYSNKLLREQSGREQSR